MEKEMVIARHGLKIFTNLEEFRSAGCMFSLRGLSSVKAYSPRSGTLNLVSSF